MVSMTVTKASFRLANSKSIASSEILNILHAAMYVEWQFLEIRLAYKIAMSI